MRGFAVPQRPPEYWECARVLLNETNPNTFLEWLLLGPDRNVKLHLLIPTQFGVALSETRHAAARAAAPPEVSDVLAKQQECQSKCAKCQVHLATHPTRLYQVVLRIASGQGMRDVWNYDFFMCFLCADCQTVRTCSLFKTSEAICESLSACIAKYGFAEAFTREAAGEDLMDAYLERFILLNQHTRAILEATMHVSRYCYHCGKQVKRIKWCAVCKCVRFCKRGECLAKATRDGHQRHLCIALYEMHLFHVEEALFVDLTGEKVLPCNRYRRLVPPPPQAGEEHKTE